MSDEKNWEALKKTADSQRVLRESEQSRSYDYTEHSSQTKASFDWKTSEKKGGDKK
jgi:hypothetical protein